MSRAKFFTRRGVKIYDPDNENDNRAQWAEAAILTFESVTGVGREDALPDLLTDLMHWADRQKGVNFDEALEQARKHYCYETSKTGEL